MKKAMAELLDSTRLEKSSPEIVNRFIYHLKYDQGKDRFTATPWIATSVSPLLSRTSCWITGCKLNQPNMPSTASGSTIFPWNT